MNDAERKRAALSIFGLTFSNLFLLALLAWLRLSGRCP